MKIAATEVVPFAIPYRRPLALAHGETTHHRAALISITDDAGNTGNGELAPGPGCDASTLARAAEEASKQLHAMQSLDLDPSSVPDLAAAGNGIPGVEAALLDLAALHMRVPMIGLFGRTPNQPLLVPVNAMIDRRSDATALSAVDEAIAAGVRCIKIKLDPQHHAHGSGWIRTVRLNHPELGIRIDCNGAWQPAEARDALRALEPLDIEYVEQPCATLEELAELRRHTSIPIAADESLTTLTDIDRCIDIAAADVLVLKPTRIGFAISVKAIELAAAAECGVVVTSNLETSIGIGAATHIAALAMEMAPKNPARAHGLATASLLAGDLVERSLEPNRGVVTLAAPRGIGVTPSAELLRKWRDA